MSFGIVTLNFRRPTMLRMWLASMDRLRYAFGSFPIVVVGSEKEDKMCCIEHDVQFIRMRNIPISEKWNAGFRWMKNQDVDYILILGSDDIMSNDYLARAIQQMQQAPDVVYTTSIYFYSADRYHTGELFYFDNVTQMGVGRCIHSRVLDQIGWVPYIRNLTHGMDMALTRRIKPFVSTAIEIEGAITDVKTRINMNHISIWARKGTQVPADIFLSYLSDAEKKLLERIKK